MRIAMFGHKHIFTTEGGIEVVVSELVPLLAMENEVTVYDRWEIDSPPTTPKAPKNVKIKHSLTHSKSAINAQLSSLVSTLQCLFGKYDIIHIHAEGPCVFLPLLKLFRKRTVVTIHGLDWQRDKWGKFAKWYIRLGEKMAAKYADRIIVLSKDVQDYFKKTYNRDTVMIRNGVSIAPNHSIDELEKFGIKKHKYVLYLGRFAPEKRLDLLYDAYKKSSLDMKMVFAGPFKDLKQDLEWYKEAAKDPDVIFTGHVSGALKDQLYTNAGIFVLPSNLEGMSISLLEALGYGCRVVASDIPENKDIMHGFGKTFVSGDVESLAEALKESAKLPINREEQMNFIKENYDWGHVAGETLKLYEEVLKEK